MTEETINYETVAESIFGDTNKKLCDWDTLSFSSKKGFVKTNFIFHTNNFKRLIRDKNNNVFFQGLINIKYLVGLIWLCIYIYNTRDYYFFLTLPICFLLRIIIEFFWYRRWVVAALLTALVITAGHLLKLNSNYYYYIAFIVTISTMVHSVYNTFLTELIYLTKENFAFGIDEQYVSEIFDGYTKKRHKGPFYKHNLKKG